MTNVLQTEKLNRDVDNLTPLDGHDSLLMEPTSYKSDRKPAQVAEFNAAPSPYEPFRNQPRGRTLTGSRGAGDESQAALIHSAADMGAMAHAHTRSMSRGSEGSVPRGQMRQPTLPNVGRGW